MGGNKQRLGGLISFIMWLLLMYLVLVPGARGEDRALLVGVGRYAHFDDKLKGVSLDIQMMTEFAGYWDLNATQSRCLSMKPRRPTTFIRLSRTG